MNHKELLEGLAAARPADFSTLATKSVSKSHESVLLKTVSAMTFVIDRLEMQIAKLEQRIEELESSGLKYCGTHQCSMDYRKGHATTFEGALWVATRDVSVERPGRGDGWQLAVKSGRDPASLSSSRTDATTAHVRNGFAGQTANPRTDE